MRESNTHAINVTIKLVIKVASRGIKCLFMKELNTHAINVTISATKKGTRGGLGPPRRSQICHQKVPNLTSEGPKLYLRSKNGLKKEENA